MKTHRWQGLTVFWALLVLSCLHEMVLGQPQVYFKASLPSKSLPRIGRRSDVDFPSGNNNDIWNDLYAYNPRPESVLLWKKIMGDSNFYPAEDSSSQQYTNSPSLYKYKERK